MEATTGSTKQATTEHGTDPRTAFEILHIFQSTAVKN